MPSKKHPDEVSVEKLDHTPMGRTVGLARPPSIHETIKRLVANELSARAAAVGRETFEEADDFEVGDDYDPHSPHELDDDQDAAPLTRETNPFVEQKPKEPPAPPAPPDPDDDEEDEPPPPPPPPRRKK